MTTDDTTPTPEELAALYAAGVLPLDEAADVEARLEAGDPQLAGEIASYESILVALAEESEPTVPHPQIKERLLEQVARTGTGRRKRPRRDRFADATSGFVLRRRDLQEWVDLPIPGLQQCVLFHDSVRNIETRLIRAAPGATLPAHPHRGLEECYVLEGDFQSYGKELLPGDYMVAPPGSVHPESHTRNGCLILVTVIGNAESPA
jgi:anti-sigma factor ChrR (cupin superfamily)